jgi:CheY-like chemotaxis protein
MSEDFISMKILIVSEAASDRELLRQGAAQASIPVDASELGAPGDPVAMAGLLARENFDVVFFDSRIAKPARQEFLHVIRAAPSRPLAVLIAPATIKTREVFTDGLEVDSALAKPIDLQETIELIACCIRARLPQRVLIVDDSSTVRSVVRKVLLASRCKLTAEEAADGAAAIELAKKQRFDIVFLDCQMPGIDGFATLGVLKTAHPDMKVVMITGTRDHRIEDRARTEGARDFLFKPFFAKDIDAVLNRLFGLAKR